MIGLCLTIILQLPILLVFNINNQLVIWQFLLMNNTINHPGQKICYSIIYWVAAYILFVIISIECTYFNNITGFCFIGRPIISIETRYVTIKEIRRHFSFNMCFWLRKVSERYMHDVFGER